MARLSCCFLTLATALVHGASLLPAQSDRPATGLWQCDNNTGARTIYATRFFEWRGLTQEAENAFRQYLQSAHGYKDRVTCRMARPGGMTLAQLDADMQRQWGQFRAQGFQVVSVPWTIASPGVTVPYTCYGLARVRRPGMADSAYIFRSKTFRIPVGTYEKLGTDWITFLKNLHPDWYFQSQGCVLLPADPAAHQAVIDAPLEMFAQLKPNVREVDWEYRPGGEGAGSP